MRTRSVLGSRRRRIGAAVLFGRLAEAVAFGKLSNVEEEGSELNKNKKIKTKTDETTTQTSRNEASFANKTKKTTTT